MLSQVARRPLVEHMMNSPRITRLSDATEARTRDATGAHVEETSRITGGDFPDEVTSKLGFDKNKMGICV